jgi:hypothetical protein
MAIPITDTQREFIIILYRRGRHTQAAIADLAGTTQGNVSKVLSRARRTDPSIPGRCAADAPHSPHRRWTFAASQLGATAVPLNLDGV